MKTKTFASLLIFFVASSFSQITSTKVADEKINKIEVYDSLRNFLGIDYAQYKNQEFYLIPKSEILRKYGFEGFLKDINVNPREESNIYQCCESFNSKYNALAGKYFTVIDVLKDPVSPNSSNGFLKLIIKGNGDTVYYKYSTEFSYSFPFLVVGYYDKQKLLYSNTDVLIRPFPKIDGPIKIGKIVTKQKKVVNIETGDEIVFIKGEYVRCLDVTIDEKYYELSLLLVNGKGHKFLFPLYTRDLNIQRILTKDEAEHYKTKFGQKNWDIILDEKVEVGFSEEMVRISWGKPDKINRASYGDQWIYGERCLYFDNGNLKSFN